jgi:hypothetical protein
MTLIKRNEQITKVEVKFVPEVMEVVAQAIYDACFQTSNQSVNEDYLESIGFTEQSLESYLKTLVIVRQALVTGELKGRERTKARNLYVPAGVAQMLVGLGEVHVGNYIITPGELGKEEVAKINWTQLEKFSATLVRLERIISCSKNILVPDRSGDSDIMVLCVDRLDSTVALKVHANASESGLHPLKQAFALMAGIKLVNDLFDVVYPSEIPVNDWRSTIYEAFSKKVDR